MATTVEVLIEHRRQAGEGDDSSFAEVYARTFAPLVAYCAGLTRSRADAEDLAQEAMVRAWSSYGGQAGNRAFWPWLTTTARRLSIDVWRSEERRAGRHRRAFQGPEVAPGVDEVFEEEETGARAVEALRSLSPGYQRVVALRDIEEWSYDEIAAFEGVTVESVRGTLRRARGELRSSFQRLGSFVPLAGLGRWWRARLAQVRPRVGPGASTAAAEQSVQLVAALLAAAVVGFAPSGPAPAGRPAPVAGGEIRAVSGGEVAASLEPGGSVAEGRGPAAHVAPQAAAAGSPVDVAGTVFEDVAPTPTYATDHTLFASTLARPGCVAGCQLLLRSTDGGATWYQLGGLGFAGGSLFFAPNYPEDQRLFAAGVAGLQASTDGGASFQTLAPIVGRAAFYPSKDLSGWMNIFIGSLPGWRWDDGAGLRPITMAPPPQSASGQFSMAFPSSLVASERFLVGGSVTVAGDVQRSAVFRCSLWSCDAGRAVAGLTGTPELLVTQAAGGRELLVAWRPDGVALSTDGGMSFEAAPLPTGGRVRSVVAGPGGRLFAAVGTEQGASGILRSDDGGRSWIELSPAVTRGDVVALRALGSGLLLAVRDSAAGGGVVCSADGARWHASCTI